MRNLALRSAEAANETSTIIETSIQKVNNGIKTSKLTVDALEKITESSKNVTTLIEDIARASNEQANAINQINVGIGYINDATQSASANSQEGAAISEELTSQSQMLKEMVGSFKLS